MPLVPDFSKLSTKPRISDVTFDPDAAIKRLQSEIVKLEKELAKPIPPPAPEEPPFVLQSALNNVIAQNNVEKKSVRSARSLSPWEIVSIRRLFLEASGLNQSGEISREEIKRCLLRCADLGFVLEGSAVDVDLSASRVSSRDFMFSLTESGEGQLLSPTQKILDSTGFHASVNASIDRMFDALDTDGTGSVSWFEFLEALCAKPNTNEDSDDYVDGNSWEQETVGHASGKYSLGSPVPSAVSGFSMKTDVTKGTSISAYSTSSHASRVSRSSAQFDVEIPTIRFRNLTAEEARGRAAFNFNLARKGWKQYGTLRMNQLKEKEMLRKQIIEYIENGNRLIRLASED